MSKQDRAGLARISSAGAAALAAAALGAGPALAAPSQTEAQRGEQLFRTYGCYQCHGTVGQGGGAGPRLAPNPRSAAEIMAIIRKPIKEMPPYNRKVLNDADVTAIQAYLSTVKPPPPIESLGAYFTPAAK